MTIILRIQLAFLLSEPAIDFPYPLAESNGGRKNRAQREDEPFEDPPDERCSLVRADEIIERAPIVLIQAFKPLPRPLGQPRDAIDGREDGIRLALLRWPGQVISPCLSRSAPSGLRGLLQPQLYRL